MTTKIISEIEKDRLTGLNFATDDQGNRYLFNNLVSVCDTNDRVFLCCFKTDNFVNNTEFLSIPNYLTGESKLIYTPIDCIFKMSFIHAAQEKSGVSLLGIYIDNALRVTVPLYNEMHYLLFDPWKIYSRQTIEIKFKTHVIKNNIGITVGGYLDKCV